MYVLHSSRENEFTSCQYFIGNNTYINVVAIAGAASIYVF